MTAETIIELLDLKPLPGEGGFYRETWKSPEIVNSGSLPANYKEKRSFSTCIYYLLTPDSFSALHALPTEEIWHFYLGDPIEQLQLFPDGTGKVVEIGNDFLACQIPQVIVPKGVWQGSRLKNGGKFALVGTTMSPGFEFEDYLPGNKEELLQKYPDFGHFINQLI
jgi:predicted cupin superfamily sugar epimerase